MMLERARKSRIGRMLCRLFGDEHGAVMMEYVILAVLIAAAAVVAVAMFGKTIVGMFDTAAKGATGDHSGAKSALEATRSTQEADAQSSKDYHDSMHK
jgi:Flp pilus assembly pilin Flp